MSTPPFATSVAQDGSRPKTPSIYLTDQEWRNLKDDAASRGVARNTLITKLLRSHLAPGQRFVPVHKTRAKSRRRSNY